MDISEVQELKSQLESDLLDSVREFCEQTGLSVNRIKMHTVEKVDGQNYPSHVELTVGVPSET
jgi:hypothetical protein